jgi:multidrug efflux pump subunit AcrA (membrane-fusion protein)
LQITLLLTLGSIYGQNIELSATVISDNEKFITSRFMGFIKDIKVSEGDVVKKGQLLYEIDSKDIDSAKSQVELTIEQAKLASQMFKNQYDNLSINLKRHQRLYKKDMVSKFEVENLELNGKNLQTMLEQVINEGQQSGEIRKDIDSEIVSVMLNGSIRMLVKQWKMSGYSFDLTAKGKELIKSFRVLLK